MHYSTLLSAGLLAGLADLTLAGYSVQDTYAPSDFFSMFSFFTGADPTAGFVDYVNQETAQSNGLLSTTSKSVRWNVDSSNQAPSGRESVRLTSTKSYNEGLFILDVAHMPTGCGTWPAFWLVGPNWPYDGEVDIIEGVNQQETNEMTLHTGPNCDINSNGFDGNLLKTTCDVTGGDNTGCGINATSPETFGSGLNSIQGGVYATEWTSSAISIWFFPRGSIPSDVSSGNPNPSSWGTPLSSFAGGCEFSGDSSSFKDMQIVFDTTFCGVWAGQDDIFSATCPGKGTCNAYVQSNPSAFTDAYWEVNSLVVYSSNGASSSPESSTAAFKPSSAVPNTVSAPVIGSSPSSSFQQAAPTTSALTAITNIPVGGGPSAPSTSEAEAPATSTTAQPLTAITNIPVQAQSATESEASTPISEQRGSRTPLVNGQPIPASFFGDDGDSGNGTGGSSRKARRHAGLHRERRHARDVVGILS